MEQPSCIHFLMYAHVNECYIIHFACEKTKNIFRSELCITQGRDELKVLSANKKSNTIIIQKKVKGCPPHTSASSKVYIAEQPSCSLARLPTECITISWHLSTPPIIIPYSTFIKPSPFFYIQSTDTSRHEPTQIQWTPTRNFWKLISILWWISKAWRYLKCAEILQEYFVCLWDT